MTPPGTARHAVAQATWRARCRHLRFSQSADRTFRTVILAMAEVMHKPEMLDITSELIKAPGLLFILGMFTLLAGLAMVLAHNALDWR